MRPNTSVAIGLQLQVNRKMRFVSEGIVNSTNPVSFVSVNRAGSIQRCVSRRLMRDHVRHLAKSALAAFQNCQQLLS